MTKFARSLPTLVLSACLVVAAVCDTGCAGPAASSAVGGGAVVAGPAIAVPALPTAVATVSAPTLLGEIGTYAGLVKTAFTEIGPAVSSVINSITGTVSAFKSIGNAAVPVASVTAPPAVIVTAPTP